MNVVGLLGCGYVHVPVYLHARGHQAVTTIRNLSANPSLDVKLVMDGVVPPLINLLRSPNPAVQEQAIVAVRNLSINPKNKVSLFCVSVHIHWFKRVCVCV